MEILAFELQSALEKGQHILTVAIGLGLVIFFHEFGHFAVAKWCGVFVERFSIGFGPILWSFKKGETEYALSAVPFGGYVKMLGQDDLDPSQLTSEEIARDPKAYSNKTVGQRMAIISAGVIMNIITGLMFYALAFHYGVETAPSMVGNLQIGKPAWERGLRAGDKITRINGRETRTFADIMRGTTLSSGEIEIEGVHTNQETFSTRLSPDSSSLRRIIGVSHWDLRSLTLMSYGKESSLVTYSESPAAATKTPFEDGDTITAINGEKVDTYFQLLEVLARRRSDALDFEVQRASGTETIHVEPQKFADLGLVMDIEKIAAIQQGSPAATAGFLVDDKITKVNGADVGTQINPLFLSDHFEKLAGEEVEVQVKRLVTGSPEHQQITLKVTPTSTPAWIEQPRMEGSPLSIPSIGIAYHLTSTVLKVAPDSPAAKAGIQVGAALKSMTIEAKEGSRTPMREHLKMTVEFTDTKKNVALKNMAFAMWALQEFPSPNVTLEFVGDKAPPATLKPQPATEEYYLPQRGLIHRPLSVVLIASTWTEAAGMGWDYTRGSALDIYATLRNLFTGELSVKNLQGPVGIAKTAYEVSQEGVSKFLLFLGFLSVNLAVLNFLPIPVLDGGHMVFLTWEAVTRRKPSRKVLEYATYCGFLFVVGLMIFVICLDVFVNKGKG